MSVAGSRRSRVGEPSVRLRHELAASLAIQGGGAASVLAATVWLGAALGPQVQGAFNHLKSGLEFVGAFAAFGLPQALFFHLRSGRIALATARRWVLGATGLALPIGAIVAVAAGLPVALAALALAAFVAQALLRSLLLGRERSARFNLATAAPQLATLAGVGLVIALGLGAPRPDSAVWLGVFAIAYGATATLAWRWLAAPSGGEGRPPLVEPAVERRTVRAEPVEALARTLTVRAEPVEALPAHRPGSSGTARSVPLLRYGLAAWLTAALATAAILAVQRWVELAAGPAALGRYTMATTLTQVPLTPIAYAAPLLFRRWIDAADPAAARRWSVALAGALLAVAALVGLAARWRDDLGLGVAYAGTTGLLAVLMAGGAAEAASRVLAVQASATGVPWRGVQAEVARAAVLVAGWLAFGSGWLAFGSGGPALGPGGLGLGRAGPALPPSAAPLAIAAVWAVAAAAAATVLARPVAPENR